MQFNNNHNKKLRNGIWASLEVSSRRPDFSLAESICFPPSDRSRDYASCLEIPSKYLFSIPQWQPAILPPPLPPSPKSFPNRSHLQGHYLTSST